MPQPEDLGSCGECELFGNSIELLGDVDGMGTLCQIVPRFEDETDVAATGFCPHALDGLVAEDSPACSHKIEPLYVL